MIRSLYSHRSDHSIGEAQIPESRGALAERYLTQGDCETIFRRIAKLAPQGDTRVTITSVWRGTTRWVRNALLASMDHRDHRIAITRYINGANSTAVTNQIDDLSLTLALRVAERQIERETENVDLDFVSGPRPYPALDLFKAATYNLQAADRSAAAGALVAPAAAKGVLVAGYLEVSAKSIGVFDTQGLASYAALTTAQYAVTVRDSTGTASGWAGIDHADWSHIDAAALSQRALDKCLTSVNPVAIEPGRYTVILEPQAVHDLMQVALLKEVLLRLDNEQYDSWPYNLRRAPRNGMGVAKFGMQVMDARISISSDPLDPEAGYVPFDENGIVYPAVTWIKEGVLHDLPYDLSYALNRMNSGVAKPYTAAFRMSGGDSSVNEMIAGTARGVLVTRFVGVHLLHRRSLLATGTTADGTWLVERGQLSHPVKNMRFNMSPLVAFNQVEALGHPERVYAPDAPAIVPPVKLREFLFTSYTDAI